MSDRLSPDDAALKTYTRLLIEKAGGLDAAAACVRGRVGRAQLGNYQSANHDQHMPIDVLVRLTAVTGNAELLEEVAHRCRHRVVAMDPPTGGNAIQYVAAVAKETNEALQALAEAMGDGKLCADDRVKVKREILDVIRVAKIAAAALGPIDGEEA